MAAGAGESTARGLEGHQDVASQRRQGSRRLPGNWAPQLWNRPPTDMLNLRNGLLDLKTRELRPHSPRYLSTVQLPIEFDPAARCPEIDQFVQQTFPEDAVEVASQLVAYVMTPDISLQKAVLLVGSGGNGKSVYLRLLEEFLGSENYSTVSLQRLEGERFSSSRLQGKLANICKDLPASDLKGSSVFKSITGGDRMTVERKYHDSYDLQPFVKLIFSANSPPSTPDASDAFFDRWIVIPFLRSFRGEVTEIPSPVLAAKLHAPRELSGLLNRALDALDHIRHHGLSEPLSLVQAKQEFRATTDPLAVWITQATMSVSGAYIPKRRLLEEYNVEAARQGYPRMTANAFGRALRRLLPGLRDAQRVVAGRTVEVWLDIPCVPPVRQAIQVMRRILSAATPFGRSSSHEPDTTGAGNQRTRPRWRLQRSAAAAAAPHHRGGRRVAPRQQVHDVRAAGLRRPGQRLHRARPAHTHEGARFIRRLAAPSHPCRRAVRPPLRSQGSHSAATSGRDTARR